ncbi:carboxypeptidase regulatory-like domain-containing protein [Pollutibacter soli]|uniref:carboxypeptidase regulatory-like domain-containing protein n=1 Tax=Pollutibacter soli TaxID=3034157 RepID=UPI0030140244
MILTYSDINRFLPVTVYGKVTDSVSHRNISGAHVFVVQGEEETFTNSTGEFVIKTWQKLPVKVTVQHHRYNKEIRNYSSGTKQLEITLVPGQPK